MTAVEAIRAVVDGAKPGELPALAGELAKAQADVLVRLATPPALTGRSPLPEAGELLTIDEAAKRLGVEKCWLYRHAKALPFSRKLGHRTLRFDARGLECWASTRRNP